MERRSLLEKETRIRKVIERKRGKETNIRNV